jgi:hypothetical protein
MVTDFSAGKLWTCAKQGCRKPGLEELRLLSTGIFRQVQALAKRAMNALIFGKSKRYCIDVS